MTTPVRVAAACVCRDSADIVPLLVAHYIAHGIREFYFAFHNDDAAISRDLVAAFGQHAKFTVYHHRNATFHQAALTNMLLELARADGCDVFVPFDSDEFYEPTDSQRRLVDVIAEWKASGNGKQFMVPMYNYFVPRDVDDFVPRTLERMTHRVEVKPGFTKEQLNSRFWWLYKSISQLNGFPDADKTNVAIGNHETLCPRTALSKFTPETPGIPEVPTSFPIVIRHIPWRSRSFTVKPLLMDRALITSVRPGEGLTESELATLFDDTWEAYSLEPGIDASSTCEFEQYVLVPDDACARILTNVTDAGFDIDDAWCRPRGVPAGVEAESGASGSHNFVSRVVMDDPAFDAGVMATRAQLERAYEEKARTIEVTGRKDARIERLEERVERLTEQKQSLTQRIERLRAQRISAEKSSSSGVSGTATTGGVALPSEGSSRRSLIARVRGRIRSAIARRRSP